MKSYKIKSFLFLFIILFSPASNAFCEEVYYNDAKIKMLIPADWTMQYEENGQIAIGPNGDIVIIFMLMKSDATSDATELYKVLQAFWQFQFFPTPVGTRPPEL